VNSRLSTWLAKPTTTMLLILAAIIAMFAFLSPTTFFTVSNAQGIFSNTAILLVVAVGATFIIITSGIDLSVGSVLVFSSVVGAQAMAAVGGDSLGAILVGLLATLVSGGAWGLLNGVLIARAKVPPFVTTLGTLGAAYGLALVISGGVDVRSVPGPLVQFGNGRWLGVPVIAVIAAVIATLAGLVLATTVFGRRTYAIGSNEESARRAGIRVERHLMSIYTLAGVLAGLGGFLSLARFGTTTIAGNTNLNLQAITAVVIGGTSLFGGIGWMAGTAIGAFIPVVLANGFIIQGVVPYWQYVAVGSVLVAAVLLDQRRRRRQLS